MAYQNIDNLYKAQEILMLKECYALEKIHGTSAHISYKHERIGFFSGGSKYEDFVKLFDADALKAKLDEKGIPPDKSVHIYGEAYGGKQQGMRDTYGNESRFVAFEVKIGDTWLNVPKAHAFVESLGLEFVYYEKIPTTLEAIDAQRDAASVQAQRNGVGVRKSGDIVFVEEEKMREGIVLRPLEEFTLNNGKRLIAKHKRDEFRETKTPRQVSPEQLKILENAKAIADEWVTHERLNHILNRGEIEPVIENTGKIIALVIEDIIREASGEIVDSPEARKQISRATALIFKERLRGHINSPCS
jgi:hypothetical protein